MGVTVHFRGTLDDLDRVEDFEDRVVDLALEIGSTVRIWRSTADDDLDRVIRGVILDIAPGQETTCLLVSPEGWLLDASHIEDSERGDLQGPPGCFVKTQYGSVDGHVTLIELLAAVKQEFVSDLDVNDEGGYWEHRDPRRLAESFAKVQAAIAGFRALRSQHGLSAEAAEDPEIVAARVERIAQQVHNTLSRPSEHPPIRFTDDNDEEVAETEELWDQLFKNNRRKQERLNRAIEERMGRGEDAGDALENAMRDEGIIGLPGEDDGSNVLGEYGDDDVDDENAPWRESLPDVYDGVEHFDEEDDEDNVAEDDEEEDSRSFDPEGRNRHPLQKEAMDLMLRLYQLIKDDEGRHNSHFHILQDGAGEMIGGLAQALSPIEDDMDLGLSLVQLKRALRGAAFALGALFPLSAEKQLDNASYEELRATIEEIHSQTLVELTTVRDRLREGPDETG